MSSETSMVATDFRLQEWVAQVRDCQGRPSSMSVVEWCTRHDITKANYYYRLRRVREACLESISGKVPPQQIVPVGPGFLQADEGCGSGTQPGLDISIKGVSIHVTESTPMSLLTEVLKAVQHAE